MKCRLFFKSFILFAASFIGLGSVLASFSLGTQNKMSLLEDNIIKQANDDENGVNFKIYLSNGRIESIFSQDILYSLKNVTYSYALASRYFASNFYFSISYDQYVFDTNVILLESQEKPKNNENYVIQGTLNSLAAERVLDEETRMYTNYYYLSHSNDGIYFPSSLADVVLEYFSLSGYDKLLYSSSEVDALSSKVQIVLKSKLNESFSLDCKLRGIFDSMTHTANRIQLINSDNYTPVALCSSGIFDNITFAKNGLYCLIANHKENPNDSEYHRFFNVLKTSFSNRLILDYGCNSNKTTSEFLSTYTQEIENILFFNSSWIYLILGSIFAVSYSIGILFLLRRIKIIVHLALLIIVISFVLSFIFLNFLPINLIDMPSSLAIYYSIIVLAVSILFTFVFTYTYHKSASIAKMDLLQKVELDI